MKKLDFLHLALPWLGVTLLLGGLLPLAVWLLFRVFVWGLCAAGGISLLVFFVVFAIEMQQDFGTVSYAQKHLKADFPFDPETQEAVLHVSVCTGETAAGFQDKATGHFTEVLLLRTPEDLAQFRKTYGLSDLKRVY